MPNVQEDGVKNTSKICPSYGNKMSYKSKHCIRCSGLESKATIRTEMTIGEYREKMLERGYHRSWLHSEVRNFARSWNEKLRKYPLSKLRILKAC